jgi:hypothetical protein
LLTGVLSNTVYRIAVGAVEQIIGSTAEHTLYFTTTQSGPLHISIAPLSAPPAAVGDLRVTHAVIAAGTLTATLRWTAPLGAVTYTLRYSGNLVTDANWASAITVSVPFTASAPGSLETLTAPVSYIIGTVYFGVKSQNAEGAWSALSNNAAWPRYDVYLPIVLR